MSSSPKNEAHTLVSLAATGDRLAQQKLVARLQGRVHTIALSILGNRTDAEDTTQACLFEILRSAGQFRGDNLVGWADKIAVRTAIRHAKQRRIRATQYEQRPDFDSFVSEEAEPELAFGLPRTVVDYLSLLPETRRVAVVLRHVMDYTVEEIAELTETSPNTVKDRLVHARAQLRRLIRRDLSLSTAGGAND
ncbi:MAG: sigma-70 family RNA polymerase sigma factor [Polyangiaceae bacterium]